MSKLIWDKAGEHIYETGVDHGVLYPTMGGVYQNGVVWNGLTSVSESPSGAESSAQYADNIKYLNLISAEEFGATIEAFTYPDEFSVCDGSAEPVRGVMIGQQNRRPFGLSYRTLIGNDLMNTEYGYKVHLIYGATASPSERAYSTVNDSPEAITFSWEVTTVPVEVPGYKPTASLTIDSTKVSAANMAKLEEILYGTTTTEAHLPMPEEVFALLGSSKAITITVDAPELSATVIGKTVSELQSNVAVVDGAINGHLKWVENFTEYSTEAANQSGNFLALEISAVSANADGGTPEVTYELLGGSELAKKLDGTYAVVRVTNVNAQSLKITAIMGDESAVQSYSLKNMELDTAASLG